MNIYSWVDMVARLTVVVGHFGSGKTEFSVNLAMALGAAGHPFALADLDFVDPSTLEQYNFPVDSTFL